MELYTKASLAGMALLNRVYPVQPDPVLVAAPALGALLKAQGGRLRGPRKRLRPLLWLPISDFDRLHG